MNHFMSEGGYCLMGLTLLASSGIIIYNRCLCCFLLNVYFKSPEKHILKTEMSETLIYRFKDLKKKKKFL